ncbi:hypothetical protein WJX82_010874 [Trebouxia sp. C0006]
MCGFCRVFQPRRTNIRKLLSQREGLHGPLGQGTWLVAPDPFFNAQWRQHRNGCYMDQTCHKCLLRYSLALMQTTSFP